MTSTANPVCVPGTGGAYNIDLNFGVVAVAPSTTTVTCPSSLAYTGSGLTPCTAVVTGSGGLNQSLAVTYSNNINAGTATASASYPGDATHSASSDSKNFTISAKTVTVTPTAGQGKTYGASDPTLAYSLGEAVTVSGALARAVGENVGGYAINLGTLSSSSSNYTLVLAATPVNFTISAKTVTVARPPVRARRTVPRIRPWPTRSARPSPSAGHSRERLARTSAATRSTSGHSAPSSSNYTLVLAATPVNFTITQRPITVTADADISTTAVNEAFTKVYGNADPSFTYRITSGSLAYTDALTGSLARDPGQDVASYAVSQGTLTAGTNYDLTFVGSTLTITQRPITVTADADISTTAVNEAFTKVYGNADPSFTYRITSGSLAYTDALTGSLARDPGQDVASYAVSQGALHRRHQLRPHVRRQHADDHPAPDRGHG